MRTLRRGRLLAIGVAAVITASTAAGCSQFTGSSGGTSSTTLTMWTENYAGGVAPLKQALASFTKQTGIKVNYTPYSTDALKTATKNAAGTSAMPDIFQLWTGVGQIGFLLNVNAVQPLDSYYQKYNWTGRFTPAALSLDKISGHYMGVPFNVHGVAILYRKDLFAKAGIAAPPTTYQQLEADNQKLLAKGITPMSLAGQYSWDTMRLTDSLLAMTCGLDTLEKLRTMQADWESAPCAEQALADLQTWVKKGWVSKNFMGLNPDSNAQYTALYSGQAAMTIDGDWTVAQLQQAKQNLGNWGFFAFPSGSNSLYYFTESLWMSSSSSHKAEAARLLDYLTSPAVQEKYFGELNTLVSPTQGVATPSGLNASAKQWISFINQYQAVYLPTDQVFPAAVVTAYMANQDQVVLGQTTPAGALKGIQAAINTYKSTSK